MGLIVTKARNDISIKFMNIYVLACVTYPEIIALLMKVHK